MKKRIVSSMVLSAVAMLALAGCTSGNTATTAAPAAGETTAATGDVSGAGSTDKPLRVMNGKIEIDTQLKEIAKVYQEKTGQEVIIESIGGGADAQGQLKSYLAANNMPDMFVIGGDGDYANWGDYVADLGDAAFVKDTDFAYVDDKTGTVVGFPYAVEGYGITYNADILEKAGVDPATLINADGYKAAFEKIDAMKDELGLQAVASVAAESGQMFWSIGNHLMGYYYSGGLERDDNTYYDMAMKGEFDDARLLEFTEFLQLLFDYSDEQVLISGTYDDQLALWATGKTAFITQGNWVDPSLPSYDVNFKVGMAPFAFTKADMPQILADSPSWWVVYKDGNVEGSKAFMDFLATTDEGQEALVAKSGMISPYKSSKITPTTPLAVSLKSYVDAGNTSSWAWSNMPEGIAQNALGQVFELFAKGEVDAKGAVELIKTAVADYVAENAKN